MSETSQSHSKNEKKNLGSLLVFIHITSLHTYTKPSCALCKFKAKIILLSHQLEEV